MEKCSALFRCRNAVSPCDTVEESHSALTEITGIQWSILFASVARLTRLSEASKQTDPDRHCASDEISNYLSPNMHY